MGLLVNGKWVSDDQQPPNHTAPYHNKLGSAEFPFNPAAEPGRYHLYVSYSCPFAMRAVFARSFYGLEDVIGLSIVYPGNTEQGWTFKQDDPAFPYVGDKILNKKLLQEVYLTADPHYTGRVSVPLLVDTKPGSHSEGGSGSIRIISGESAEIVDEFEKVATQHANPQESPISGLLIRSAIQAAKSTDAAEREKALEALRTEFAGLDAQLAKTPYFGGAEISNIDFKAFPFLVQLEVLTTIALKNPPKVSDYKHLEAYAQRVYRNPNFSKNVHLDATTLALYAMLPKLGAPVERPQNGKPVVPTWIATAAQA